MTYFGVPAPGNTRSRPRLRRAFSASATALALLLGVTSCDSLTSPRAESPVAFVGVAPGSVSAQVGTTVQFDAVLLDAGQRVLNRPVTWGSSDSSRATVSSSGLVTALANGSVTITAVSEGMSGSASLTIDSRIPATIEVVPDSVELPPYRSVQLSAIVRDIAGDVIAGRQLTWTSSHPDILEVQGDGYAFALGHDALVTVTASLGGLSSQGTVVVLPDPCLAATPIARGDTREASLSTSDCLLSGGNYAARWRIDLTAASTALRIDMSSPDFDSYLILTDLTGNVIEVDDDSGPGSDARISGPVPAGSYIIMATSFGANAFGNYTLAVSAETLDPCQPTHPLALNQSVVGYLSTLDCFYDGRYLDQWSFSLASPTTIRALMRSSAVNSFLTLSNSTGQIIMWDDDSGGGNGDAAVATTLPAGSYTLWATSFDVAERGRYTLSLQTELLSECRSTQPITQGQDIGGALTTSDCRLQSGQYADRWRMDITSSRIITIDMLSNSMDTYLSVSDLEGNEIAFNDDGGTGTNASLTLNIAAGSYIIWATTAQPAVTGTYLLSVR
jgi:hypothetical protein